MWCVGEGPARTKTSPDNATAESSPMVRPSLLCLFAIACGDPASQDPTDTDVVAPICADDADCDDGDPCNGAETCGGDACLPGVAPTCEGPAQTCVVEEGEATCAVLCALPRAPVLEVLDDDEVLVFQGEGTLETAVLAVDAPLDEAVWLPEPTVALTGAGPVRVLARTDAPGCTPEDRFDHVYDVQPAYPGPAGTPSSRAIAMDDPRIVAWATGHVDRVAGTDLGPTWSDPTRAQGPAEGTAEGVLSLGRGGRITLTFDVVLADGDGPDLVVFENGFTDTFLELARVEVGSGSVFVAFDSAARTPDPVDAYGAVDPTTVHGLAGVYRRGQGTPFDLALLRQAEAVRSGQVDLDHITQVRIVDVVGDGADLDSFGRPIHDPYPTVDSAGFDLDAVGVLNVAR